MRDVLDVDDLAVAFDAASKHQHLLDEVRAAVDVGFQRIQQLFQGGVGNLLLQQLDGDEDWRQHVVEIVRDAAGERAEAFHALRAQKLDLQLFLVGGVNENNAAGAARRSG